VGDATISRTTKGCLAGTFVRTKRLRAASPEAFIGAVFAGAAHTALAARRAKSERGGETGLEVGYGLPFSF